MTHPSQWFVQTFQDLPAGLVAPRKPLGGPSGTPEPAVCLRSCLMTSLGSPNPHLGKNAPKWESVISVLQDYCERFKTQLSLAICPFIHLPSVLWQTHSVSDMCALHLWHEPFIVNCKVCNIIASAQLTVHRCTAEKISWLIHTQGICKLFISHKTHYFSQFCSKIAKNSLVPVTQMWGFAVLPLSYLTGASLFLALTKLIWICQLGFRKDFFTILCHILRNILLFTALEYQILLLDQFSVLSCIRKALHQERFMWKTVL